MTRAEVATEAFTVGQRVAGLVLGIPFCLGLLALHNNNPTLLVWAMCYMGCVVFPVAACVSSAMASFVAPMGQERAYAKSTGVWCVSVLFALTVLFASMQIYAYWPFVSGQQLWQALVGPSHKPIIPILLGGVILVPIFAAFGYVAGCHGQRYPAYILARFLKWCWKLSKKDPLSNPIV